MGRPAAAAGVSCVIAVLSGPVLRGQSTACADRDDRSRHRFTMKVIRCEAGEDRPSRAGRQRRQDKARLASFSSDTPAAPGRPGPGIQAVLGEQAASPRGRSALVHELEAPSRA